MLIFDGNSQAVQKTSPFIKDVTAQNFTTDVLDASQNKIVLVDFWAPWCEPCKQLAPLLERVVKEQEGKIILAKINVDENPEIAAQLKVQSIPIVYAFFKGQPVDAFMGIVSEQKLQAFLSRLTEMMGIPEDLNLEETLKQAQEAFDKGDYEEASRFFAKILKQMPEQENALAGLAHCYLMAGTPEPAEDILKQIPDDKKKTPQADSLINHLALIKEAKDYVSKDEKNSLEISYQNSLKGFLENHAQKAIEELLTLIQTDRNWQDGLAKTTLLKVFAALGHSHSLTLENRRKLSTMIFS